MASRRIRHQRFKLLDEMGLDEICDIYFEQASGVRDLMARIFEPTHGGHKPGAADFYAWLDARGYRDEWRRTVEIKPLMLEDQAMEYGILAMDDPRLMRGAKAVISEKLWQARRGRSSKAGERRENDEGAHRE
jgi:hypothetical protein